MKPVRVIGLGSPFGDDRIGWLAVDALNQHRALERCSGRVSLMALDRPGAGLLAALRGADAVVLIDGLRTGAPPGSVLRLTGEAWAHASTAMSSHGLGVAAAVRLAAALAELPKDLVLFGVEIRRLAATGAVSREVRRSLPILVHAVGEELARLQTGGGDLGGRP